MVSQRSKLLGYLRLVFLYLFVGALVWFSRPTPLLFGIGGTLVLAGEGIRIWAAGHLVKSLELVDSGPYAYTQNPLYLGRLLILTGFCVMAKSRWYLNWLALAAGYAVFFFYYIPRKLRVEGARLRKMHGEAFARYHDAVPILFPLAGRFPGRNLSWSMPRFLRNQEYMVVAGVLTVCAFFAWKTWS